MGTVNVMIGLWKAWEFFLFLAALVVTMLGLWLYLKDHPSIGLSLMTVGPLTFGALGLVVYRSLDSRVAALEERKRQAQ